MNMTKQELIDYCLTFPDAYEDYPFDEAWTAMRHLSNAKTFAFIYIRNDKLCLNLKCDPMRSDFLRSVYTCVQPAYHMNKEHWNTVVADGDVPPDELFALIQHSYELTKPAVKKGKA
jgi:predicted DNA-binding protein (MmcQ/YjbR family)